MKNKFVMIGNFIVDLVINEEHVFEADVTDYPVENGGSFTDNIRPKPMRLTMKGIVTNTPVSVNYVNRARIPADNDAKANGPEFVGSDSLERPSSNSTLIEQARGMGFLTPPVQVAAPVKHLRSDQAYAYLKRLMDSRDTFVVRTSLGTFPDMAMSKLSIPRSKETGDVLEFSVEMQQVQKVTNPRLKSDNEKTKRGPKGTNPKSGNQLIKWNRRIYYVANGARQSIVLDTVYVEYRVAKTGVELWYPDEQPISLAALNFNIANGQPHPYASYGEFKARKLSPVEVKAFNTDMAFERELRDRKERDALNATSGNIYGSDEDLVYSKVKTPDSNTTRKPLTDMSKKERKLPYGSGFDPAVDAFKRPFQNRTIFTK